MRMKCATTSHKQQKVILNGKVDRYYISGIRGGQAFTEPHVPVDWINQREQQVLESIEKTLAVWKLFFKRLEASYVNRNEVDNKIDKKESEATKELQNIDAAKENLKTPKRSVATRLSDIMESAVETQSNSLPKRQKLVRFKDNIKTEDTAEAKIAQISLILDQWNEVITQVETLQSSYDMRIKDDQAFREKIISANFDLQLAINRAEDMGRLLQDEIGASAVELHGMTVWEGVEKLVYDTSNIQHELEGIKTSQNITEDITEIKSTIASLQLALSKIGNLTSSHQRDLNKLEVMEDNLIKFKDHYMKSYSQFRTTLGKMELRGVGSKDNESFRFNEGGTSSVSTDETSRRITKVENELSNLQNELINIQHSLSGGGSSLDIEKINARVKEIESRVSGDSCSINHGEYIFTSITEVGI